MPMANGQFKINQLQIKNMRNIKYIVVHCTATPKTQASNLLNAAGKK
jgi:hypothetical protein